uniref:Putative conserved secreted protein n=1 Tax=Ixodes ricinus TaxID=34613 RepID=A0A6B0V4J5_IXORI
MWKILAVFCVLCSAVTAQDIHSSETVTTSSLRETLYNTFINTVFDKVLSSVAKSKAIDPVTLPNISYAFETKIIVKITAEAALYRGVLEGLSSLTRTGNCRFEVGERGIDIKADVGAGPLNSSFVGLARAMGYGQAVTVDVNITYLQILLGLAQTPGSQLELSEFKVQQMRGVTVAIHGLGLLSRVFNKVSAELTNLFEVQIKDAIEKKIREGVAVQIRKLNNITFF